MSCVNLHRVRIETVRRRAFVIHVDNDLVAFACLDGWAWCSAVEGPSFSCYSLPEIHDLFLGV